MPGKIRFGVYELDPDAMELRKHGVLIRLQEQPLRVLAALLERPGEIVIREQLQAQIWDKDTFVDFEQSLNKAVNRLRETLNDDPGQPRYIETVPRRGYRFIAPVTGNTSAIPSGGTAPSSAVSPTDVRESGPRKSGLVKTAALALAGILVALAIAGVVLWWKPRKPTLHEARHMTSAGCCPTLSRDGKLLAYLSTLGGNQRHIWIQQTAGGDAIPVTTGPDPDFDPDFSPDGTRIVFASTRGGGSGSLYFAPTLPGEPRLVVSGPTAFIRGPESPRFSPSGREILYLQIQEVFIVPVDGGPSVPLSLNRNFLVNSPPLWSPSGNEIIFYGVSRREPNQPSSWWIAPLAGGDPRPAHLAGAERDDRMPSSVRAWTRTKDGREWIVYSVSTGDSWKIFRIEPAELGQVDAKPEQLASGTGDLDPGGSFSEDGRLAYTIATSNSSIYEIPTDDRGQKLGPTVQIALSGEGDDRSPSVSRDGRWMAYDSTRPGKPNTILLRDLSNLADRFLDDRDRRPGYGGDASISPDGSRVIFARDCKIRRRRHTGIPVTLQLHGFDRWRAAGADLRGLRPAWVLLQRVRRSPAEKRHVIRAAGHDCQPRPGHQDSEGFPQSSRREFVSRLFLVG